MSKRIVRYSAVFSAGLLVGIILLAIGSVKDELVAQKITMGNNFFTYLCEAIGKFPLYLSVGFACGVLHYHAKSKEKSKWRTFIQLVYIAGGVLSFALMMTDIYDLFLDGIFSYGASAATAIGLYTLLCFYMEKFTPERLTSYKKWAICAIIIGIVVILLTFICKYAWGRARPYDVIGGRATFSPWYKIVRQGGSSFFSGHSACATGIFIFFPLLIIDGRSKKTCLIYWAASVVFVILIVLGRLFAGAHYLTDVSVGMIISVTAIYVTDLIAFGKKGYIIDTESKINKYL